MTRQMPNACSKSWLLLNGKSKLSNMRLSREKIHPELEKVPKGLQAILSVENTEAEGAIFVLKNKDELRGKNQKNQLHPYYILYVNSAGDLVVSPEESKKILDLCTNIEFVII